MVTILKSLFGRLFYRENKVCLFKSESNELKKRLNSSIRDNAFIEWANLFFSNWWHFRRPISINELVASFLEHRGDNVTTLSVKKNREDVLRKMALYCGNLQYVMNPKIVYRSDMSSKHPRSFAWVTPYENDCPAKKERVREYTRCCFFYRMGDEPRSEREVLACPERDEEKLEEKEREEND